MFLLQNKMRIKCVLHILTSTYCLQPQSPKSHKLLWKTQNMRWHYLSMLYFTIMTSWESTEQLVAALTPFELLLTSPNENFYHLRQIENPHSIKLGYWEGSKMAYSAQHVMLMTFSALRHVMVGSGIGYGKCLVWKGLLLEGWFFVFYKW